MQACRSAGMSVGEVRTGLRRADQAEEGLWPVAGGVGDQTERAIDLFEFIWAEEARIERERDEERRRE